MSITLHDYCFLFIRPLFVFALIRSTFSLFCLAIDPLVTLGGTFLNCQQVLVIRVEISSSAIATNGYSGCEKPILVACAATPCFLAVPPPAVLRRVKGQETAATTGRQRVFLESR